MTVAERKMSVRERKDAEKRRRLADSVIDAAEILIETSGVRQIRARDVAIEAGCSVGSLYNAFEDFDEIILRVNSRTLSRLGDHLRDIDSRPAGRDPADRLVSLSHGYLEYAMANRTTWAALFEHRMPDSKPLPEWHLAEHMELIAIIDGPVSEILPDIDISSRQMICRTLYSAVHGIVSIGSENRLGSVPNDALKGQLELAVRSVARGLSDLENRPSSGLSGASALL